MLREKAQAVDPRGRKYRWAKPGADRPIVVMKRSNVRGAKGVGHSWRGRWVNGEPEEHNFLVGRREPSVSGTSRMRRESHVRLCVQQRLACSAGDKPAGAKIRSLVVWIAGWRETKTLKPIDNVSRGEPTSHRAVTTVNANVASKVSSPEGRAPNRRAKAAWGAEI